MELLQVAPHGQVSAVSQLPKDKDYWGDGRAADELARMVKAKLQLLAESYLKRQAEYRAQTKAASVQIATVDETDCYVEIDHKCDQSCPRLPSEKICPRAYKILPKDVVRPPKPKSSKLGAMGSFVYRKVIGETVPTGRDIGSPYIEVGKFYLKAIDADKAAAVFEKQATEEEKALVGALKTELINFFANGDLYDAITLKLDRSDAVIEHINDTTSFSARLSLVCDKLSGILDEHKNAVRVIGVLCCVLGLSGVVIGAANVAEAYLISLIVNTLLCRLVDDGMMSTLPLHYRATINFLAGGLIRAITG